MRGNQSNNNRTFDRTAKVDRVDRDLQNAIAASVIVRTNNPITRHTVAMFINCILLHTGCTQEASCGYVNGLLAMKYKQTVVHKTDDKHRTRSKCCCAQAENAAGPTLPRGGARANQPG